MELADSCFASDCLHFGNTAFWRENMEHLVEADRGWRYMMGEQVPESFIMSQLLGLLLPSAKTTLAGWCSWQIRCRLFEARPFLWGNVSRSCWWFCIFIVTWPVHERSDLSRTEHQCVTQYKVEFVFFFSFNLNYSIFKMYWQFHSVDHFGSEWNMSTTIVCIAMKNPWVQVQNVTCLAVWFMIKAPEKSTVFPSAKVNINMLTGLRSWTS